MSPADRPLELHQFHAGGSDPGDAGYCDPLPMHGCRTGWGWDHCATCTEEFEVPEDVVDWPARWPCEAWVLATQTPEVYETWTTLLRDDEKRDRVEALELAQAIARIPD